MAGSHSPCHVPRRSLPGLEVELRRVGRHRSQRAALDLDGQRRRDRQRDLVGQREKFRERPLRALRPHLKAIVDVDEARADANAVARPPRVPSTTTRAPKAAPDDDGVGGGGLVPRDEAPRTPQPRHLALRVGELVGEILGEPAPSALPVLRIASTATVGSAAMGTGAAPGARSLPASAPTGAARVWVPTISPTGRPPPRRRARSAPRGAGPCTSRSRRRSGGGAGDAHARVGRGNDQPRAARRSRTSRPARRARP